MREATPTARDRLERPDRPLAPVRPSVPEVAGFARQPKPSLRPWMLIAGALIVAAFAFVITRMLIG
jgi:hypothetical protein